ncbi:MULTISPECIES: RloB domain-containing protein [unclassified Bacillus cereus group]|uniref:RloB domain-containing protein n=1 Tax=unclassified Bacillus cereus group TaxID=2750818 RepID=UPI001F5AF8B8|nr:MULTISPECIES: RloB domain-containing protein [unclassified Bacillus cereus group]
MTFRLSNKLPNQSRSIPEKREAKRKYFFVLEGEKTEHIYIREIAQNVKEDSIIDVLILERIQGAHSNQYKITSSIQNYLAKNAKLDDKIKDQLVNLCNEYEEEKISEVDLIDALDDILGDMKDSFITDYNNNVIEQIRVLTELNTYEEDYDRICLILDRDYRSFKDFQYDQVLKICEENNFLLGITNPNFEFYLLLHINDAKQYDKSKLLENPRVSRNKKFVEDELNKALKSFGENYKKAKFNANFFVEKFPEFLNHIEEGYATDNKALKTELGSSVHHIIAQII